jgi:hypothetical protein
MSKTIKTIAHDLTTITAPAMMVTISAETPAKYNKTCKEGTEQMLRTIKMVNELGFGTDDLTYRWSERVMITKLSYKDLLLNRLTKEVRECLIEAQLEIGDADAELALAEIAQADLARASEVEVGPRKNGTTINGAFAISAKDGMGMVTYYPCKVRNGTRDLYISGVKATPEQIASLKPYLPPKTEAVSGTQEKMGLKRKFETRSLRMDNLRSWDGVPVTE